jgi:hypothetical protein
VATWLLLRYAAVIYLIRLSMKTSVSINRNREDNPAFVSKAANRLSRVMILEF